MAAVDAAQHLRQREESARVEPLREVHVLQVVLQNVVRDGGYELLHLLEVARSAYHLARIQVAEFELAEAEFAQYDVLQLWQQRLRGLGDEASAERLRHGAVVHLRRLHDDGHPRSIRLDHLAEVNAGIALFVLRLVARVQYETNVRNYAQKVLLVAFVGLDRIFEVGRQQHFRAGALARYLLLFVIGILQELAVLQQQYFV